MSASSLQTPATWTSILCSAHAGRSSAAQVRGVDSPGQLRRALGLLGPRPDDVPTRTAAVASTPSCPATAGGGAKKERKGISESEQKRKAATTTTPPRISPYQKTFGQSTGC